MLERMADFFDKRVKGYEDHMQNSLPDFEGFYRTLASAIIPSKDAVKILDLGAGTGIEIDFILPRVPYSQFLLVDLSEKMLHQIKAKYPDKPRQLITVNESYLTFDFPVTTFDYVITAQSLHHLLLHEKIELYKKIKRSLKPGGIFLEADFFVNEEDEKEYLRRYYDYKNRQELKPSEYHIDIPFSLPSAVIALKKAGFRKVEIIYQKDSSAVLKVS